METRHVFITGPIQIYNKAMVVNKAIFIDKDGTLIPDIPYNADATLISLSADAVKGLAQLQQEGYLMIIISNQSGIAHGYFTERDLVEVEHKIGDLLQEHKIRLDGFYFCPHAMEGEIEKYRLRCDCRKPQPGLLMKAAADFKVDLLQSWMIGDLLNDVEAGHRAGCRSIMIHNGCETEWKMNPRNVPDKLVDTIDQAAAYILKSTFSPLTHENSLLTVDRAV